VGGVDDQPVEHRVRLVDGIEARHRPYRSFVDPRLDVATGYRDGREGVDVVRVVELQAGEQGEAVDEDVGASRVGLAGDVQELVAREVTARRWPATAAACGTGAASRANVSTSRCPGPGVSWASMAAMMVDAPGAGWSKPP
jgi:hypothetical protein